MAPPTELPTTITLRIKVPPGTIAGAAADEFTLGTDIQVSARIGEIRERIQQTLPSNPAPERQRILFGGRALADNEQTLGDALNIRREPSQTEYTVHLMVRGNGDSAAPRPGSGSINQSTTTAPSLAGHTHTHTHTHAPQQLPREAHGQPLFNQWQNPQLAAIAAQHNLQQQQNGQHTHTHTYPPQQLPRQAHGQPLYPQWQNPQLAAIAAEQNLQQHQNEQALHQLHHQAQQAGLAQHDAILRQLPPIGMHGPLGNHPIAMQQQIEQALQRTLQRAAQPPPTDGTADTNSTQLAGDQHQRSASQPPRPPPRPPNGQGVFLEGRGPNGEQFQFQQHIQIGHQHVLPGFGLPHLPGMMAQGGLGHQQPVPRRTGPSAVEQARDNLVEMHRLLDELRELNGMTEEQRTAIQTRVDQLQHRNTEVQTFVDPFNLGGSTAPAATALNNMRAARGSQNIFAATPINAAVPRASSQPPPGQGNVHRLPVEHQQPTAPSGSPADVTAYLLSSPTGPQAILYSPQYGTYTGRMTSVAPQPTRTTQPASATANANEQPPANQVQAVVAQPVVAQAVAAQPDNLGALGPLINHMWLLLRVLIFAYFILGANLGWRRPLTMVAIAVGFWLLRQGPLGEGGFLRRWWDGIVNQGQQRAVPGQQQGQAQARPGQMPTPAQVAQRLLDEDRRQRNHGLSWLREQLRPAERAIALLVASLWPGVGEAYVRALEAEERRRNEEEVAARRREEEERQQREEEEKKRAEEAASSTDKTDTRDVTTVDAGTSSAVATEEGAASTSEIRERRTDTSPAQAETQ